MKLIKILTVALAVILITACGVEEVAYTAPVEEIAETAETETVEEVIVEEETTIVFQAGENAGQEPLEPHSDQTPWRPIAEHERYAELAVEIIDAFLEKDTAFLSLKFADDSEVAFEFIKELEFAEFTLTGVEDYVDDWYFVYYLDIVVEDGAGAENIFTQGGREWELHLGSEERSNVLQFSPRGRKINKERWLWDGYAAVSYGFSNDLGIFESMTDFNTAIDLSIYDEMRGFTHIQSKQHSFYYLLLHCLRGAEIALTGDAEIGYTVDEFIQRAENLFGITNIDEDYLRGILEDDYFYSVGHGWWWHYPELVSEEITDNGATVVISYYADSGYLFVGKTLQYNYEFTDTGAKLISVELLYSNDDLVLAKGAI
ncbi:MAG: hypothetical protein FWH20_03940 [Oscillospiraceae bacterium]|nr:hypothetical protein [Oscillospiraceae bacterium]